MTSIHPQFPSLKVDAREYKKFVNTAADNCPDLKGLDEFLTKKKYTPNIDCTAKTSLVQIIDQGSSEGYKLKIDHFQYPSQLQNALDTKATDQPTYRLFIVQNADPDTIARLGAAFGLDPHFFAEYLDNSPWYRIARIQRHLPPLASVRNRQSFFRLRWMAPRKLTSGSGGDTESLKSFVWSEQGKDWVKRKAGRLRPQPRIGEQFKDVLFTRHSATVWFSEEQSGAGWNGIILLQPPFVLEWGKGTCGKARYRTFRARPGSGLHPGKRFVRTSMRESLTFCLEDSGQDIIDDSIQDPFILLQDLFRIIASEWTVALTYLERELVTIEYRLEKEDPILEDLEDYLKDLFIHRRRVGKYRLLIQEARDVCASRGKKSWPSGPRDGPALAISNELVADFDQVEKSLDRLSERIMKNIDLLTALVAVGEGKLVRKKNHSLAMLTKIGVFFVPFGTVAAILGMQGRFAPDGRNSWVFWTVSVSIWLVFAMFSYLYERTSRRRLFGRRSRRKNGSFMV